MAFRIRMADRRLSPMPLYVLCLLCSLYFTIGSSMRVTRPESQDLFALGRTDVLTTDQEPIPNDSTLSVIPDFLNALDVLQQDYFEVWQGIWPTSIEWTSAVMGTYISAALTTLSTSYSSLESAKANENLVNRYFSQLAGSYFGQDIFELRQEAYDDMLWVVLGWLESIKFINTHSALHYANASSLEQGDWYGTQYIPAFSHRARVFWDLASQGWNTTLCDGGMIWSPYLLPYKNAITNELYIAASISMYLYFPGDDNTSPFSTSPDSTNDEAPGIPHDIKYLAAAIDAYNWLKDSNMTNSLGLYVDGFHISGWTPTNNSHKRCDERNEMVYTYNQGVLLSGTRGLYEATGSRSYLEDGHELVEAVINATGWDLLDDTPPQSSSDQWFGLGRWGILEEACDETGDCSQDGQTFKGIFFHHLTVFCSRLPSELEYLNGYLDDEDFEADKTWHDASCARYASWIKYNAQAALMTQDAGGKFGTWWGASMNESAEANGLLYGYSELTLPDNAVDYRNLGVPPQWTSLRREQREGQEDRYFKLGEGPFEAQDLNDRGRGRTVETQGGGVAVLRAAWELADKR